MDASPAGGGFLRPFLVPEANAREHGDPIAKRFLLAHPILIGESVEEEEARYTAARRFASECPYACPGKWPGANQLVQHLTRNHVVKGAAALGPRDGQ